MTALPASSSLTARAVRLCLAAAAVASLAACSVLEEDKIDYKSARRADTLSVPPDLTQLARNNRYSNAAADPNSALALQQAAAQGQQVPSIERAAPLQVGDAQILREGERRWLLIDRPAQQLWEPVREFWQEHGFVLSQDDEKLGIVETDWAENRAKIPQDFIRTAIGKVFDGLYSTGERDRFRTRLERRADGKTEIYITHRGMQEVYTNTREDHTVWQPRAADAELEAEFLRRLMVKLGASQEHSQAVLAAAGTATGATPAALAHRLITTEGGQAALELPEAFDRAWRRVGVSLDRTGFTVEDRDRNAGVYYVRYLLADESQQSKKSWFGNLFGSKKETFPSRYQIRVQPQGDNAARVQVFDEKGQAEASAAAQKILSVIAADLR